MHAERNESAEQALGPEPPPLAPEPARPPRGCAGRSCALLAPRRNDSRAPEIQDAVADTEPRANHTAGEPPLAGGAGPPLSFIQRPRAGGQRVGRPRAGGQRAGAVPLKENLFRFRRPTRADAVLAHETRALVRLLSSRASKAGAPANASRARARAALPAAAPEPGGLGAGRSAPAGGASGASSTSSAGAKERLPGADANAVSGAGAVSRLAAAALHHWRQHGLHGTPYGYGTDGVKPNILLGIALAAFIVIQVVALAFVAWQAYVSVGMLRKASAPDPRKISRNWELIPGISWKDWLPPEKRHAAASLVSQAGHSANQRRTKDAAPGGQDALSRVTGQVASAGRKLWRSGERRAYVPASGDDGGRAANRSRLQEMLAAERQPATAPWSDNSKEAPDKSQAAAGELRKQENWDALESTLAVATRRADMNKRILDMLDQSSSSLKRTPSLDNMLDSEYDSMLEVEYGTQGVYRRERSPRSARN